MPYERLSLRQPLAAISLDLEEDHAGLTPELRYEAVARLPELVSWFAQQQIPLTIFVAGNFLEKQGRVLEGLTYPEFHSHGYWHPPHQTMWRDEIRHHNIRQGLAAFESFFKRKTQGYRAGCGILKESDFSILVESGVKFDSSFFTGINVSGFHLFRSDCPRWYKSLSFLEIPISRHVLAQVPVSMAYMKLMGSSLFSLPQRFDIGLRPLVFNFHLHDLVETSSVRSFSPFWRWIYSRGDAQMLLQEWLFKLKESGLRFVSMNQLYETLQAGEKR